MSQYINEAFKKFRLLEDFEEFSLTPEGLDNLGSFMGQALDDEAVDVFDLEAEAQEDLKKSYVGKVICDCNVCHSNIFYDKEDIVIDDDGIVNAEDECPYCMSTDGYTIIGEIKEWAPGVEDEIEDELSDDELADEPIEIEDEEETEVVKESLKRKSRKRKLTESSYIPPTDYKDEYISKKVIAKVTTTDYDEDDNGRPYTFKLAIKEYEDGSLGWEENGGEGYANMPFDTIEDAVEDYKNWADDIYDGDFTIKFAPKFSYLSESLKLDGVKSLRGTKGLRRRPERRGVKSLRAREDKSGVEDLTESNDVCADSKNKKTIRKNPVKKNPKTGKWVGTGVNGHKEFDTKEEAEKYSNRFDIVNVNESKKLTEGFEEDVINASGKYPIMLRTSDVNATNKLKKYCSKSGINSVVIPCAAIDDIVDGRDLLRKCKSADLVIIEDINRAIPELQAMLLSVVDRRNPYSVVAVYDDNYPANIDIDNALLDRFRVYDKLAEDLNESNDLYADVNNKKIVRKNPVKKNPKTGKWYAIGDEGTKEFDTEEEARKYQRFDLAKDHAKLKKRKMGESIEDVTINTEDETMTMTTKEDGGVVVETSPKQSDEFYDDFDIPVDDEDIEIGDDVEAGDEVIAPISDETEDEILGNSEEEDEFSDEEFGDEFSEEEIPEGESPEEEDVEVGEFDEETFDGLGESYLRRCYDNVNGYKTTQVRANNNTLIIEGVISFKSGSKKKTNFVFESKDAKNGRYIFEGYNAQINNGKPVFKLNCSIKNKTIVPTSFKYNYTSKNALNESVKLSGTVKAKRK